MHQNKRSLLHGLSWNFLDKLCNQVGFFFVSLYIARIIGPENIGIIGLLTVFLLLSECVLSGFSQALIQKSDDLTENDSSTIFYVCLCWSLLFYCILYISAPYIAQFYNTPEITSAARVMFIAIFISSLTLIPRTKLIINIDFKGQAIATTIGSIIGAIIAIYMAKQGYGYWAIITLNITKLVITALGLFICSKWLPTWKFSYYSFTSLFKFGSYLMTASMINTISNNLSLILVGKYFTVTYAGYFTQAKNMSNQSSELITSTFLGVTYPLLTSQKKDIHHLSSIFIKLISTSSLIATPALIGIAAISDDLVLLLLGAQWQPVAPLLSILCIATILSPINGINMNLLKVIGRPDLFLKIDLMNIAISMVALFLSISFGIIAIALAMVCTSCISFLINTYYSTKFFNFGALQQLKIIKNYIIASIFMFLIVSNLTLFTHHPMINICTKILIGIVTYMLSLLLLKDKIFISYSTDIIKTIKHYYHQS